MLTGNNMVFNNNGAAWWPLRSLRGGLDKTTGHSVKENSKAGADPSNLL